MEMKFYAGFSVVEINKFFPNLCFSDGLRMQGLTVIEMEYFTTVMILFSDSEYEELLEKMNFI